ncbi:MAG: FkbM family methyltransferase [Verrucomicrobia subdivision 3 bacterium]|nr:FkbM family methyltransferase [Limisphaerales bacterium]
MLQRFLLWAYRQVQRTGALSTAPGRAALEFAYDIYKARWEASSVTALKQFVRPGTCVVDVGANLGFFSRRFAEWVRPGGLVLAIEPEARNFESLTAMLSRRGLANVEAIRAAAAEASGMLKLHVDPCHHANHRIADAGAEVRSVTLDGILAERRWPAVSLVKIDVQGAEERVLRGASETLRRLHPALFIEVDHSALRAMNSSAERVLALVESAGYQIYRSPGHTPPCAISLQAAIEASESGAYGDFLCLYQR